MKISELRQREVRTLTTSRGMTVRTFLTDAECLKIAANFKDKLNDFGKDLLVKAHIGYGLSPNQWPWLHKLVLEQLPAACSPDWTGEPEPAQATVIRFDGVRELMNRPIVTGSLKRPKIRFRFEEGPLHISLASENSRTPGALFVSDGGPYGANVLYGRVHIDGTWEPSRMTETPEWVLHALRELGADPASYAAGYGKLTGNCCFCGLDLTDPRSVTVGYGPICAEHYGLPWGEVKSAPASRAVAPSPVPEEAPPVAVAASQAPVSGVPLTPPWLRETEAQEGPQVADLPEGADYAIVPLLRGQTVAYTVRIGDEVWTGQSNGGGDARVRLAEGQTAEEYMEVYHRLINGVREQMAV